MSPTDVEAVLSCAHKRALAGDTPDSAVDDVMAAAGGDRHLLEAARDVAAERVHLRTDDFESTAALQMLNRVLSRVPIVDPLDWRVRWGQRFRKP
jgi:hypothetical protein